MRHLHSSIVALAAVLIALGPASAQQRPSQPPPPPQRGQQPPPPPPMAPPKPYKTVLVGAPAPLSDASFEAFRKQLDEIAKRKDRAGLGRLVVAQGFFWEGEKGNKADKRKSGADNLAVALQLSAKDGSGWEALAGYASDPTASPLPGKTGVVCGPAEPVFNAKELQEVAKATGTDEGEWGYPMQPGLEVRAAAQPNAPVVEKLGMHFIRVMPEDGPGNEQNPMLRVVTPTGKVGFVPVDALSPLGSEQLCYVKDASGWKIAGFIGGDQ